MEKVFGRFVATTQCISGVYASEYSDSAVIDAIRKRTDDFVEKEGRRPRILLTKMGQDGHDRGVKVVATAFADLGFDVDISPMFQTPEEAAKMAHRKRCPPGGRLQSGRRPTRPSCPN